MTETNDRTEASEYEFTEGQNEVFSKLGGAMRFVGVIATVAGLIQAGSALMSLQGKDVGAAISTTAIAVLLFVIGAWTIKASRHVTAIVTTRGNDIAHLMSAMGNLTRLYVLQKWAFALLILIAVLGVFVAASEGTHGAGGSSPDPAVDGTR
jgi:hypothetical protein